MITLFQKDPSMSRKPENETMSMSCIQSWFLRPWKCFRLMYLSCFIVWHFFSATAGVPPPESDPAADFLAAEQVHNFKWGKCRIIKVLMSRYDQRCNTCAWLDIIWSENLHHHDISLQENLGPDLGFDLGLAAAPAPQNGLDGTADFFVKTLN